jgi:hypothetical protein
MNRATRVAIAMALGLVLLGPPVLAQSPQSAADNSDPVRCFWHVYRSTEVAVQAYQAVYDSSQSLTKTRWAQEGSCRAKAPAAPELDPCWDLVMQARPLIEQAADLYERARRAPDGGGLVKQANSLMSRAAEFVREARACFAPILTRWQQNGGRYVPADAGPLQGRVEQGAAPPDAGGGTPGGPVASPPLPGPQGPVPDRPPAPQPMPPPPDQGTSPGRPPVLAARAVADAISAGDTSPRVLGELNKPPLRRPLECREMMVDAASKRRVDPDYSRQRAEQAVACYEGKAVDPTRPAPGAQSAPCAALRQDANQVRAIRDNPGSNVLLATSEFYRGVTDFLVDILEFLCQPRGDFGHLGTPAKQLIDYLVNHKPQSHAQRFQNAVAAVEQWKRNPAYATGRASLGTAATVLGARVAVAAELRQAASAMVEVNASANRIASVEQEVVAAARTGRAPRGSPAVPDQPAPAGRDVGMPSGPGGPPRSSSGGVPPTCFRYQCFRNALAVDQYWRTGRWVEPTPRGYPLVEELSDLPTPTPVLSIELRNTYGGARALDPLHGPNGLQNSAAGNAVLSSRAQIEQVMRQLGRPAQGLVLLDQEVAMPDGTVIRSGHIFNVRATAGGVEYFDRAFDGPPSAGEWAAAKQVFFYRTR